jgi:hypothetical protein
MKKKEKKLLPRQIKILPRQKSKHTKCMFEMDLAMEEKERSRAGGG